MTFLATLLAFAAALSVIWLAALRSNRQHECSCGRSQRILTTYERNHPRSHRPPKRVLVPVETVTLSPVKPKNN